MTQFLSVVAGRSSMRCTWGVLFVVASVLVLAGRGQAAHVEADPNKDYPLTVEAGPWLIVVHYYTGPNAAPLAKELVQMIRSRDNLPAYLFNRGAEERRQQQQSIEQMRGAGPDLQPLHLRTVRVQEQCAVLVGGYPDMDTARKALNDVKRLKEPDNKNLMDQLTRAVPLANGKGGQLEKAYLNPFLTAFVVPNPLASHQTADHSKADPLLKDLNDGRPYNLLNCKQPYTLAIKEFPGAIAMQSRSNSGGSDSFLSMLGLGNKTGAVLDAGAKQAEELARVLRVLNFDAYVLHTRTGSIVTVGNFERADDSRMQQMQRQFAHAEFGPIKCAADPQPMWVPRP
jgi:hypothetical protein